MITVVRFRVIFETCYLKKFQKKAARMILYDDNRESSAKVLSQFGWKTLSERRAERKAILTDVQEHK